MKANPDDSENELPEIIFFKASAYIVGKNESFSLSWETKNAEQVEIFRNGITYLKRSAGETSVSVQEKYDGKDKLVEFSITASNDYGQVHYLPLTVRVTDVVKSTKVIPEIIDFSSDKHTVTNKEPFTLSWQVRNASNVVLMRNGMISKEYGSDRSEVTLNESYDGRDKEITYHIIAYNKKERVESATLNIAVKEAVYSKPEALPAEEDTFQTSVENTTDTTSPQPEEEVKNQIYYPDEETPLIQGRYHESQKKTLDKIRFYLWGTLVVIMLALFGVLFYVQSKPKILDFDPKTIAEDHSIVIVGKNFPVDTSRFHILFNNVKGLIQSNSKQLIRVVIPAVGTQIKSGKAEIQVAMVYKGDTILAPDMLVVTPALITQTDGSAVVHVPSVVETPVLTTVKKKTVTPKRRPAPVAQIPVKVDSLPPVVPEPPRKADKIDIFKLVSVSSNDDFKKRKLGGVRGLKLTVDNSSPYDLDNVTVTISFLKKNEREVRKENVLFTAIRAHTKSTLDVPDNNRGAKVKVAITAISSRQLDADL